MDISTESRPTIRVQVFCCAVHGHRGFYDVLASELFVVPGEAYNVGPHGLRCVSIQNAGLETIVIWLRYPLLAG